MSRVRARGLLVRMGWLLLLVAAVGMTAPAPAAAHLRTGVLSTDFEARIGSFRPAVTGASARVLDGDQRLELRVSPAHVVVVLGLLGEPFLRFSHAGVEVNLASPTATSTHVIKTAEAVSPGRPRWRRVRRGHVLAWHENRLRPLPVVHDSSSGPHEVASWSIPLVVNGRRISLTGTEWFSPGPPLRPWLVASVLALALAGVAALGLSARKQYVVAAVSLSASVVAMLVGWSGILLDGRVSLLAIVFAAVFSLAAGFFLLAAVSVASGPAQLAVMALIGAFAATFALPELSVFGHGFVLSVWPPFTARLTAAIAVVGGLGATIVCVPAVIELFELAPSDELSAPRSGARSA